MAKITLKRITQSLGVVAAAVTLAVAGISAGSASAAAPSPAKTKAQWQAAIARAHRPGTGCYRASYPALRWQATRCATAPRIPLLPAPLPQSVRHAGPAEVGDGTDYSAQIPGLISQATGTFQDVSPGITEQGYVDGAGPLTANAFSLQLNSQFFAGSPACDGSGDPSACQAWQQFVYAYDGSVNYLYMQYWVIGYDASCPAGWFTYSADCYTNSNAVTVSTLTASQLATVQLTGSATSGGNDSVSLSVGSGQATSVTGSDSVVALASHWNTTEWGVYGDGGGSEAYFGSGATLQAQTALTATSSSAPSCIEKGFTAETNNLTLTSTPALGSEPSPTMATRQTNGTTGTANCSVASSASSGDNPPAVAITGNGTADVFWKGTNGDLYQASGAATGTLTLYNLGIGPLGSAPAAGVDSTGRAYVYWEGTNQDLWETYWNGSAWAGPYDLGFGPLGSPPAVAITGNGTADVFWKGTNGDLYQASGAATGTLTLYNLGIGPLGSAPAAGVDSTGRAYVYWEGTNQDLWETYWNGSAWAGPYDLGFGPLG